MLLILQYLNTLTEGDLIIRIKAIIVKEVCSENYRNWERRLKKCMKNAEKIWLSNT